ncbi:MAG TPA: hypothetical protein VEJ41_07225 [Candidatus Acidoferrales bacterium]|nr:hypothetical protein [Candidatus Acidoferrales bacterium]
MATWIALSAIIVLAVWGAPPSPAATSSAFSPGDQIVYDITVELQQHHVLGTAKGKDTVTDASAQGTATFAVYSVAQDGIAFANVTLDFKGTNAGQPVEMQSVTSGKILPDGQLLTKAQVGLGVSDALGAANTMSGEIAKHGALVIGKSWTNSAKTPFISLDMKRTVIGQTNYQGFTAIALRSEGSGSLLRTADGQPTAGTITVGGTTYYDEQNRVLVGEAFRTLMVVQPASATTHDDYSSAFNVVLGSWTHASPAPQASVAPQPADTSSSDEDEGTPTPTPTPMAFFGSEPESGPAVRSNA